MAEDFMIEDTSTPRIATDGEPVIKDTAARKKEALGHFDPTNRAYSVYLMASETQPAVTQETLEQLALSPQSAVEKTKSIITIIRNYANKDDIVGMTLDCVDNNVNNKVRFQWPSKRSDQIDETKLARAKAIVALFNEQVGLKKLIPRAVSTAYAEGTYIMCLRQSGSGKEEATSYIVDYYPIGVALISSYEVGGDPYVLIDITELRSRLQKSYPKTKKNKALFFAGINAEVEATYPPEVYQAFLAKEKYAKLDMRYSGVVRINTHNKQYGLSPVFRALFSTLMLESFARADRMNASSRAKKIVAQIMNKDIAEGDYAEDQAYAHDNLMEAWKQRIVAITLPPTVRDLKYIEPKGEMTDIETVNFYRNKVMNTLGIAFLGNDGTNTANTANISIKQLMKMINRITEQLESILMKWYRTILVNAGIGVEYAPKVSVVDAELMESELRIELAKFLYSTMNASMDTVYDILGLSMEDEFNKRTEENLLDPDTVFKPRITAFTASGTDNKAVTPASGRLPDKHPADPDKQAYDKDRNVVGG